jgi:prophage DNA circulation protein
MARIDIEFVEAGELTFPKSVVDPKSKLSDAVSDFRSKSSTGFLNKFNVVGNAAYVAEKAQEKVEAIGDFIGSQTKTVSTLSTSVTDLAFSVRNLKADAADLIQQPEELQSRLSSAMRLLTDSFVSKKDSAKVYSGFYGYGSTDETIPSSTLDRDQQRANAAALNNLISEEALGQAAIDASLIDFTSEEDADAVRTTLFDEIERQKEATDDDDIYSSLLELKSIIGEAIPPANQKLPSIVEMELPQSLPSLSLTYSLYESLELEQDVIDRNEVEHPGFIPGGVTLKVLTNV